MKVKELIAKLEDYDGDMEVWFDYGGHLEPLDGDIVADYKLWRLELC
jgi:hypothetical protein